MRLLDLPDSATHHRVMVLENKGKQMDKLNFLHVLKLDYNACEFNI